MIAHRTFTEQTTGLTGQGALDKREKLRGKAEEFIASERSPKAVIVAERPRSSSPVSSMRKT